MIALNVLLDFCNAWWLWWILPFLLGGLLVYTVMKKWRRMYEGLIQGNRIQKKKISKSDEILKAHIKEIQDLKGQLAIQRGKIRELETIISKNR